MVPIILTSIAVLLRILSNPLGNVFQKQLTASGNHPLVVNFVTYLALAIACILLGLSITWNHLPTSFWTYSILAGIAGAVGNGFLVKALQKGDLSVLGPVNSYKSVVGIIIGIFILREIPNIFGIVGIALIIAGSYFVLDTTEERFSWALLRKRDIQFRIWAMILTAIEAVFIKKIILASSPAIAFISWCWFGALFSFCFLKFSKINIKSSVEQISRRDVFKYLYVVICIGVMQMSTNYVFDHMPVGYALSLFQLSTIISVLLGFKFFSETDIKKKMIGSAIMVVGSIIVIVFKNG